MATKHKTHLKVTVHYAEGEQPRHLDADERSEIVALCGTVAGTLLPLRMTENWDGVDCAKCLERKPKLTSAPWWKTWIARITGRAS